MTRDQLKEAFESSLTPQKIKQLREMRAILEQMYGESRFQLKSPLDIFDELVEQNQSVYAREMNIMYDIIIHYPEVKIRNSRTAKDRGHLIRDLYVKFSFDSNLNLIDGPQGVRTTFLKEELAVLYSHSHLPPSSLGRFNTFCTGSGPINRSRMTLGNKYDPDEFKALFYNLNMMVAYESLEGTPYINMSSIGNISPEGVQLRPYHYIRAAATLVQDILKNREDLTEALEFNFTERGIEVKIKDKTNHQLAEEVKRQFSNIATSVTLASEFRRKYAGINQNGLYVRKTTTGGYTTLSASSVREGMLNKRALKFKGNWESTKLAAGEGEISVEDYLHPSVIFHVEKQLSNFFTKTIYEYDHTKLQSPPIHLREGSTANSNPVLPDIHS